MFKAFKKVLVDFLPLIYVRDDYRQLFLVIPWAVIVAIYMLLGLPLLCAFEAFQIVYMWAFPEGPFNFKAVYKRDRHNHLRRHLASRSLLAAPMLLPFAMDCLLFLVACLIWFCFWEQKHSVLSFFFSFCLSS